MKFRYQYRTSDNAMHLGEIDAKDREGAFQILKAQGIRPARLEEAPGFFNKLYGKGKRWLAIVVLAVVAAIGWYVAALESGPDAETRNQVYGDESVLQKAESSGWQDYFDTPDYAWLARHAQPGIMCKCEGRIDTEIAQALNEHRGRHVRIRKEDSAEVAKMKRMVNWMVDEHELYLGGGGTSVDYMKLCDERLRSEAEIYRSTVREISALERRLTDENWEEVSSEWDKKNAVLRSFGLRTVRMPAR